jgi:hypothetical protein
MSYELDNEEEARLQRADRGFAESDVWNFDGYLAYLIAAGCKRLKELDHGHPFAEGMTQAKWHTILDDITNGFEHYLEHEDWNNDQVQLAADLFREWMPHLWD